MKKVLLFGTGDGAKKYLAKHANEMEVIGVLDNDKTKHGNLFMNNISISAPSMIPQFNYDEIIIVSQWAKEIHTQLIDELKIESSKIVIPQKSSIKEANKPFEDPQTRELARFIIKQLSHFAMKDTMYLLVDFGTLLGLVRDNDVIEWDDDVDFSIINLPKNFDFASWISSVIQQINFPVNISIRSKEINQKPVSYILEFQNISNKHTFRKFSTSISFRETINGNSVHLPSGGMWYAPQKHFEEYEIIQWNDSKVFAPYDYKNYLTFLYGDWQKPKKNISMADYAHLGEVDYESFKDLGIGYKEVI